MTSIRKGPGRAPGRWRSALLLAAGASLLGPALTSGCRVSDETVSIVAEGVHEGPRSSQGQASCDDNNPCTKDSRLAGICRHTPVQAGSSCSDQDVCNGDEVCDGQGTCLTGQPPQVDDGNECTQDSCDPVTGVAHTALVHHTCTDACGAASTCRTDGVCGAGPVDDGNPCTADSCDPVAGVVHAPVPSGTTCDDGEPCNGIAACDAFGICRAGTPLANGTSCSDGALCNGSETCLNGACARGKPPSEGTLCDDGNPCTDLDACDGEGSCLGETLSETPCDDGNPCTGDDICRDGACAGTALSGSSCGDGDACNGSETCAAGFCMSSPPPVIDDGDPRTIDACDPATGIVSHTACNVPDLTVTTTLADMIECLHSGPAPIQTGLTETIDPLRAAAIHGTVKSSAGDALSGVTVTLRRRIPVGPNNPTSAPQLVSAGYGSTLTRADGSFDLALNGGVGTLLLEYSRPGYLPAQREVVPETGKFVTAPEVVLLAPDAAVSPVEIGVGVTDAQVIRGRVVSDSRGTRQVTLFFQPGTVATMKMPDGTNTNLPAGQVHVRATEYTAGTDGPKAMPASLPPSSAFTYAVDLNLDEAVAAGASSVAFNPPVIAYLENFIGLPNGENVPSGAYRTDAGLWEVQTNGRVIRVAGENNGAATLDIDDNPDTETDAELLAFGIGTEERQRIAELYTPGQTLWRIPVAHFSSWDWNLGYGPVAGAAYPAVTPSADNPSEDPCKQKGSIIGCDTRSLGEVLGVVGTPFSLHYQSDRTPSYVVPIHVPATSSTLPQQLISVTIEMDVAGQHHSIKRPPEPNTSIDFVWDGKNGLGQAVQGPQTAEVSVGYEFPRAYGGAPAFGGAGGGYCPVCMGGSAAGGGGGAVTSVFATQTLNTTITLWQRHRLALHHFNALYLGLGGLTLDVHHVYDPSASVLYLGDGDRRSGDSLVTLSTFAGGGISQANNIPTKTAALVTPRRVAQAPDGSIYVAESSGSAAKIVKISPDQILTNVWVGPAGSTTSGIAVGADGSIYFSLTSAHQVYRIPPGAASPVLFAGDGIASSSADGVTAVSAHLHTPSGLAVGPDGSVYIADTENHQIRRVDVSGKLRLVAGGGFCQAIRTSVECGDGGAATSALLNQPADVAVGADGTVYFADTGTNRVRAVTPDGVIHRVAGLAEGTSNSNQNANDILSGVPAKSVKLVYPGAVAVSADGALYITEQGNGVVRRIEPPLVTLEDETSDTNGPIHTVAGSGPAQSFSGEGGLATAATVPAPLGLLTTSDGSLYFADVVAARIFRVRPAMPGLSLAKTSIASEDGAQIYVFDEERRHEKTVDSMTGRTLFAFEYDADHRLSKITDAEGRQTLIVRDAQAHTAAIVGPFGHTTTIHLGADGYADAVEAPDQTTVHLAYTAPASGLLAALTDPRGNATTFSYDSNGRLVADTDPAGGAKSLATLVDDPTHHTVRFTSPQGRATTYATDLSDPSTAVRSVTGPDGLTTTTAKTKLGSSAGGSAPVGQVTTALSDGTTVKLEDAPDPRLGLQAPFAKKITTTTGGLTQTVTRTRSVTFPPNDITTVSALVDQTSVNNAAPWTSTYQKQADGTATWTRTSPMGRQGKVTVDTSGRVVRIDAPGLAPVLVSYVTTGPNKGRIDHVSQSVGAVTRTATMIYDAEGNLTQVTSPLGHITAYAHDDNGRVTQATTPDGRVFSFQRDSNGNVTAVLPPGPGGDHHFTFDERSFVSRYTPADIGPGDESTSYDTLLDGQPGLTLLPNGAAIGPQYDSAGRLVAVQSPSGSTVWSYFSSGASNGKLSSVTSPDGVAAAFTYQGALLTDVVWTGPVAGSAHYPYDNQFRATSETIGGTAVARNWNADGALTSAGALQITYDPVTGIPQGTTAGVVQDVLLWNQFGEVTNYHLSAPASVFSRSYVRDDEGRMVAITEDLGGSEAQWSYTYDLAGRLTDVYRDGAQAAHYVYDLHGNRTRTTYAGQPTIGATFDAQDRILTYGTTSYTHAITGERLSKTTPGLGTTTYAYDATSRLHSVTLAGGAVVEYLYDAAGRRVAKKLGGSFVQRFLYGDAGGPAALVDANGTVLERYVYATSASVPDYVVKVSGNQAGTYRLIKDERGSVRLVVDTATAAIVQQLEYDAYGRVLSDSSLGFTPFGFAGGLWDADTALVRFGARDYDPETGRWTTQDPIGLGGGDTNLYVYVSGDPINYVDPRGHSAAVAIGAFELSSVFGGAGLGTGATVGTGAAAGAGTMIGAGVVAFAGGFIAGYKAAPLVLDPIFDYIDKQRAAELTRTLEALNMSKLSSPIGGVYRMPAADDFPDFSDCGNMPSMDASITCCHSKCDAPIDGEPPCPGSWEDRCLDACYASSGL